MWEALPSEAPAIIEEGYPLLTHAIELDPDSWQTNTSLGVLRYAKREWIEAERNFIRALSLSFNDETLYRHADMLTRAGRLTAAIARYEEAQAIRIAPAGAFLQMDHNISLNQFDKARQILDSQQQTAETISDSISIALNQGDAEGLKAVMALVPANTIQSTSLIQPILEAFDSTDQVLEILNNLYLNENIQWASKLHDIALFAAYFGDPELALQSKGEEVRNTSIRNFALWYPVMSEVRQLPGFKDLVSEVRLVDYWREYGWADYCRPLSDDDFECF